METGEIVTVNGKGQVEPETITSGVGSRGGGRLCDSPCPVTNPDEAAGPMLLLRVDSVLPIEDQESVRDSNEIVPDLGPLPALKPAPSRDDEVSEASPPCESVSEERSVTKVSIWAKDVPPVELLGFSAIVPWPASISEISEMCGRAAVVETPSSALCASSSVEGNPL